MRPLRLTLKNFAGIASGQGKNEVTIDLQKVVPEEAQVVAISGPNGAGKTTIMDNLHPYRVMPYHASSPTPGGFSFYDHIAGGEGCKDLLWEYDGQVYQSVLRFRATAKTKKTEAYLFVIGEDGTPTPWTDPTTGAQSDGKTDTYDSAVEAILGKPEVFFQAQFSAQGKAPIGSMTAGEVKRLIADMIGAARSAELSAKASDVLKLLKPHLGAAQAELARVKEAAPKPEVLTQQREEAQLRFARTGESIRVLRESATAIAVKIAAAQGSQEQRKAAQAQHEAHQAQVLQASRELDQAKAVLSQEKASAIQTADLGVQQAKRAVDAASQLVRQSGAEVQRLEQLVSTEERVWKAQADVKVLSEQIAAEKAALVDLTPKVMKLEEVSGKLQAVSVAMAGQAKDGEHLAKALQAARETAELLDKVPCKGTDINGSCMLLAKSNEAAQTIPEAEVKLNGARAVYRDNQEAVKVMRGELSTLEAARVSAKACEEKIATLGQQLQSASAIANTAEVVAKAKVDLVSARQSHFEAQQAANQAQEALSAAEAAGNAIQAGFNERSNAIEKTHRERMEVLARAKATLPPLEQALDVEALHQEQQKLERELQEAEANLVHAQRDITDVAAKFGQLESAITQIEASQKRIDAIGTEISKWVLLAKALGTDGIVAMSIEDAGPSISEIANDLLEECYGGRFAISLVTQAETQAGIAKETFLIQVEDNHRGESKLLDLMSGGEKVWINECLVRAIALYMAQVSDTRSQTLFSDESDGALDPTRKRQYMSMKRAVLMRGGYEREYLITQTPELLEMCDVVLDVGSL